MQQYRPRLISMIGQGGEGLPIIILPYFVFHAALCKLQLVLTYIYTPSMV